MAGSNDITIVFLYFLEDRDAQNEHYDPHGQKDKEQDLGDRLGTCRYACESKDTCDDGYDEEDE